MREVPREYLSNLTDSLNGISEVAQKELRAALRSIDYSRPVDEWRDAVIGVMEACCGGATQVAAMESAIFYDGLRERVLGNGMSTQAHDGRTSAATKKAVNAFIGELLEGDYDEFERLCCERLDYEVNAASGRCMEYNARNDPSTPRFARVPQGEKTCDFCIMLASRGPVYHTEESAGAFTKFHAHCDCKIVPFWNTYAVVTENGGVVRRSGTTAYEGYDPDAYFDQYLNLMLNPKTSDRMARTAENAHAKSGSSYGQGRGSKTAWSEANARGLTQFKDIHELTENIRGATSYEDLCDRLKVINKEIGYYGLSDKRIRQLQELCRDMRESLIGKQS